MTDGTVREINLKLDVQRVGRIKRRNGVVHADGHGFAHFDHAQRRVQTALTGTKKPFDELCG